MPYDLTPRELELLRAANAGMLDAEISRQLLINVANVEAHFRNICAKLGVKTRSEAVGLAGREGLL